MTIAELFVELGVKGSEKTQNAFKSVKTGLGDIKSMSIETKAAIVGALYGLERMMSQSAQTGTNLTNFTQLTGLSAKTLQQWQYAARQAGVSGEELTGNLKGVQQQMSNMLMGKGAPEGLGLLANKVGFDPQKARDTFYVMEQLQKFAQSDVPADLANNVLKSFGLGEGTIAAMRRNVFNEDTFKKAPTYSDGQIKQLDKVNVAWSNLGQKIQMAFGAFTSKHGMQLVSDISKITTQVLRLADSLTTLADKLKVFQLIGKSFEGWDMIIKALSNSIDTAANMGDYKSDSGGKGVGAWMKDAFINDYNTIKQGFGGEWSPPRMGKYEKGNSTNNTTVNQTLNFQHEGKDHDKTSKSVKDAVQKAYRQNGAVKGGY